MIRKILSVAFAATLATGLIFPPAYAATAALVAKVTKTLVSADNRWGGCMAYLSVDLATVLPTCPSRWVTFSCTGDFTDPVRAYRMLDQAQLALATGSWVYVQITDDMLHNGYCFANRIDVSK